MSEKIDKVFGSNTPVPEGVDPADVARYQKREPYLDGRVTWELVDHDGMDLHLTALGQHAIHRETAKQVGRSLVDGPAYVERDTRRMNDHLEEVGKHYNDNRASYQQMALDEANAAGHDVNFGGQHYPANKQASAKSR